MKKDLEEVVELIGALLGREIGRHLFIDQTWSLYTLRRADTQEPLSNSLTVHNLYMWLMGFHAALCLKKEGKL